MKLLFWLNIEYTILVTYDKKIIEKYILCTEREKSKGKKHTCEFNV